MAKYKIEDLKMANNKDIIIGVNSVIDALKFSDIVREVYILEGIDFKRNKGVGKIANMARRDNIKLCFVDKRGLDEMAGRHSHQGVIAKAEPFRYSKLRDVLQKVESDETSVERALILVLDHIKDAGNLGAIIRSAEACGAAAVIIPNKRCAEVTASTYKTSAGSVVNIPIVQVANISAALEELKQNEF